MQLQKNFNADIYDTASKYYSAGLRLVPIGDGKVPVMPWKDDELTWGDVAHHFFARALGIGIITGKRSGNIEVLDFDLRPAAKAKRWLRMPGIYDIARRLTVVETPSGGFHFYYRCESISGNTKLALGHTGKILENGKPEIKAITETRGEGGLVVAPGGAPGIHPTKRPYLLRQGSLTAITTITTVERTALHDAARSLSEIELPQPYVAKPKLIDEPGLGLRPGDEFNIKATWEQILIPAKWQHVTGKFWRRPNKYHGVSAIADETFCCFSSSVLGFDPQKQYSKFATYAILHHDGDFSAASAALAEKGYGWRFASHFLLEEKLQGLK